jgi:uncharacterized protein (DUF2336 family)
MATSDKKEDGPNPKRSHLAVEDVEKLLANPSAEARADAAAKVAGEVADGALSKNERVIAEEIFRVMVKDVEVLVRETLSKSILNIPDVSSDIARTLALDESDSVALPILEFSKVLTDEDLVEIIDSCDPDRHLAIARREEVSENVSEALVEKGDEETVVTLVSNQGAQFGDTTYGKVVDKFGESERVQYNLVRRESLPLVVAERLVEKVSTNIKEYLVTHHELSPEIASDLLLDSRERAMVRLLSDGTNRPDVEELVSQMAANGRLSASLILRALCTGDLTFFEAALAHKAGIPLSNARVLIHDDGDLGLQSLFGKADMPKRLFPAFRAAVDIAKISELERSDSEPDWRQRLIMERVLTQFEQLAEYDSDDVDYLLGRLARTVEREHGHAAEA